MRNCPHCNNEIQDEAIFCRFCRRDVEPPLWLTSLQKCPYCAEWVERGIDRCSLCGKVLSADKPFSMDIEALAEPEEAIPTPPFTGPLDAVGPEEPEEEAIEPRLHRTFMAEGEDDIQQGYDETESRPPDEGIAVLHARRLEPLPDLHSTDIPPDEDEPERRPPNLATILKAALLLIGLVAAVAAGVWIYGRLPSIADVVPPATASAARPSVTPAQAAAITESAQTPFPTARPLPTPTPTEGPCRPWEEITLADEGQILCAYGTLKRWFVVQGFPYVAIFSEEPGTFAIVDRTQNYPQFAQGTCIQVTGEVEIMRGTRPFIDANGGLESCEAAED